MRLRPFPLAAVMPLVLFIAAAVYPLNAFKLPASATSWMATALLASPFAVFALAGLQMGLRRRATPVFCALSIAAIIPWYFCLLVMAWFKPGFGGAVVLGILLAIGALVMVLPYHFATRRPRAAS
jgi:hypothetical protein